MKARPERPWWQAPRRPADPHVGRSVSFLELFYDLVYVVLISELSHTFSAHPTPGGALGFAFLFVTVWWAWFNGSTYHDLHGNNDLRTRVFTFLQMFTVAAMAVYAHTALEGGATGFALSYAAFQGLMAYLWWRTGVYDPDHRVLATPYAVGFLVTMSLFLASVFVDERARLVLWGVSVLLSLVSPLAQFNMRGSGARAQVRLLLQISPALAERYGLFMILVLAEVVTGSVRGVVAGEPTLAALSLGALGIGLAVMLWWLYFDLVARRRPLPQRRPVLQWIYGNLLTALSISATGALVLALIRQAAESPLKSAGPLLPGAVTLFMLGTAQTILSLQVPDRLRPLYRRSGLLTALVALMVAGLGALRLTPMVLLLAMLGAIAVPVAYGLVVWVKDFGAEDFSPEGSGSASLPAQPGGGEQGVPDDSKEGTGAVGTPS
jgi:low temperature requirement protein LtrA